MNKEKAARNHLTLHERYLLLKYLSLNYPIPKIANLLKRNKSSIYREIILNSVVENKHALRTYNPNFRDCKNFKMCKEKGITKCPSICMSYLAKTCFAITKPFQVCNFCEKKNSCYHEKLIYHPEIAHDKAKDRFAKGKDKIKLSENKLIAFDNYVSPLLINGQSPEVIESYSSDEDFPICSKTLRSYIGKNLLTARNHHLRRVMSISSPKPNYYKKGYSKNPLMKIGHLYEDYLIFMKQNPDSPVIQCDTVHGKNKDGQCLLTIHCDQLHFQMYFLLKNGASAKAVNRVFLDLKEKLGIELYKTFFSTILVDNGCEFDKILELEFDEETGEKLSNIFFTRPYRSTDKAECERNHELFRYIKGKRKTLDDLTQEDVDIINSNINSYPRKSLKWKTPIEMMKEKYGDDIIRKLDIKELDRKEVILRIDAIRKKK